MNRSEQINELAAALSKAQGEIEGAVRGSNNPAFRGSKYADLSAVWDAIRAPFSKHGLCVVQGLSSAENGVECETMLCHSSGQWISESLFIPADKLNAHGYGSAATYARRFGLQAIAGIAPIDDDGNAASLPVREEPAANPWTLSLMDAANKAALSGEYKAFWNAQSQEFRQAALGTDTHSQFRAQDALAKVKA